MDRKNCRRARALFALLVLAICASCTLGGEGVGIQDISAKWAVVESELSRLREAEPGAAEGAALKMRVANALDAFDKSARAFLDSELYQLHRSIPLPPAYGFGPGAYFELPQIRDLADFSARLREALLGGDMGKAAAASSDISSALLHAMSRDLFVRQALADEFFLLALLFGAFIALAIFLLQLFHKMLAHSIRQEKEGSAFSRAVLFAQEEERRRISREIHDTVAQELRFLSAEMGGIVQAEEKAEREKLCGRAAELQQALACKLRDICGSLVPPDFGLHGLPNALRRLCLDFAESSGIDCRMDMGECAGLDLLSRENQLQLFRIVQEALTNVKKHARATKAVVELRANADGSLCVNVSDNGIGMKPAGNLPGGSIHLGMRGMRERAALLGGSLAVGGQEGKGTSVCLRIMPPSPPNMHMQRQNNGSDIETANFAAAKVLLIDDHALANSGVASMLEGTGRFSVAGQARSLKEASRFFEEAQAAGEKMPSLVVLDIQLGEENGLDFLGFLKDFCRAKRISKPPALVCSAFADPFRVETALKLGAAGYVSKGGSLDDLLCAADAILRGEIYVPKEHAEKLSGVSGKYMQLTKRELELLNLIKQNKTNDQIAEATGLSKRSVETYISHIYLKTGSGNRLELMNL